MRLLLFLLLLPAALAGRDLQYLIRPDFTSTAQLRGLRVQLQFTGDADGETLLQLPNEFGSATQLYHCVQRLRCSGATLVWAAGDSQQVLLQHRASAVLNVNYELRQDVPDAAPSTATAFRPLIQPDYFHVLGVALFVVPASVDGYTVTVEWQAFPPKWLMHNSFASRKKRQTWSSPDAQWLESVFVGGLGWRLHEAQVAGQPLYLAERGNDWPFPDSTLFNLLRSTVATQRAFWRDSLIPYYTVTLLPLALPPATAGGGSGGYSAYLGTGLQQSFAAFATPVPSLTLRDFQHLFHHELMHHWIGGQIRNGGAPNSMENAWFSEGFTEYLALKNQWTSGLLTAAEYAEEMNFRALSVWQSPVAEAPNARLAANFFNDLDLQQLAYTRGATLAFYLDQQIGRHSGGRQSLRDLMLTLLSHYRQPGRDLTTDFDFLLTQIGVAAGLDAGVFYQRHVVEGKLLPVKSLTAPAGLELRSVRGGVALGVR